MSKFKNNFDYEKGDDQIKYPKAFEQGDRSGDYSKNPYAIGSESYHDFNLGVKANNSRATRKK